MAGMGPFFYVNVIVLVLSVLSNCLALQGAVLGEFAFASYRRFLISLLVSELYICLANVGLFTLTALTFTSDVLSECTIIIARRFALTGFIANLLHFCAMSIDHFIGLVAPMKYRSLMKNSTFTVTVIVIWILAFCLGFIDYPVERLVTAISPDFIKAEPMTFGGGGGVTANVFALTTTIAPFFTKKIVATRSRKLRRRRSTTSSKLGDLEFDAADMLSLLKDGRNETAARTLRNFTTDQANNQSSSESFFLETSTMDFFDELISEVPSSWCDGYFEPTYNIWLESGILALVVTTMLILGVACCVIFRSTYGSDPTKRNLRKLVLTTLLLLMSFCCCWFPYVCYEISLMLISQTTNEMPESDTDYFIHNVLYSLFMCSPFFVPVTYIARNRVVQRHLIARYGCLLPTSCIARLPMSQSNATTPTGTTKSRDQELTAEASASLLLANSPRHLANNFETPLHQNAPEDKTPNGKEGVNINDNDEGLILML